MRQGRMPPWSVSYGLCPGAGTAGSGLNPVRSTGASSTRGRRVCARAFRVEADVSVSGADSQDRKPGRSSRRPATVQIARDAREEDRPCEACFNGPVWCRYEGAGV
jgi:hypothetical protein